MRERAAPAPKPQIVARISTAQHRNVNLTSRTTTAEVAAVVENNIQVVFAWQVQKFTQSPYSQALALQAGARGSDPWSPRGLIPPRRHHAHLFDRINENPCPAQSHAPSPRAGEPSADPRRHRIRES